MFTAEKPSLRSYAEQQSHLAVHMEPTADMVAHILKKPGLHVQAGSRRPSDRASHRPAAWFGQTIEARITKSWLGMMPSSTTGAEPIIALTPEAFAQKLAMLVDRSDYERGVEARDHRSRRLT